MLLYARYLEGDTYSNLSRVFGSSFAIVLRNLVEKVHEDMCIC